MKAKFLISLALVLSIISAGFSVLSSAESAVVITKPEQLSEIEKNLGGSYILGCDLDFQNEEPFVAVGKPTEPFFGTLNGAGHTIKNIKLAPSNGSTALFGIVAYNEGVIRELNVENAEISDCSNSFVNAGLIVGTNIKGGSINDCSTTGLITVNGNDSRTFIRFGGIVGVLSGGSVARCISEADIVYNGTTSIFAGGIAGDVTNSSAIDTCSFFGSIKIKTKNDASCGGIVGNINSSRVSPASIINSVSSGLLDVESYETCTVGGISGQTYIVMQDGKTDSMSFIENCLSNTQIKAVSHFQKGGFYNDYAKLGFGSIAGRFFGNSTDNRYTVTEFLTKVGTDENGEAVIEKAELLPTTVSELSESINAQKLEYNIPIVTVLKNGERRYNTPNGSEYKQLLGSEVHVLSSWSTAPKGGYGVTLPKAVIGDANGDGKITVSDTVLARYAALDSEAKGTRAAFCSDSDGSGSIEVTDIVAILNAAVSG